VRGRHTVPAGPDLCFDLGLLSLGAHPDVAAPQIDVDLSCRIQRSHGALHAGRATAAGHARDLEIPDVHLTTPSDRFSPWLHANGGNGGAVKGSAAGVVHQMGTAAVFIQSGKP